MFARQKFTAKQILYFKKQEEAKLKQLQATTVKAFPFNDEGMSSAYMRSRSVRNRIPWSFDTSDHLAKDVRKLYSNYMFKNKHHCIDRLITKKQQHQKNFY